MCLYSYPISYIYCKLLFVCLPIFVLLPTESPKWFTLNTKEHKAASQVVVNIFSRKMSIVLSTKGKVKGLQSPAEHISSSFSVNSKFWWKIQLAGCWLCFLPPTTAGHDELFCNRRRGMGTQVDSGSFLVWLVAQWLCLNDSPSLHFYFPTGNTIKPLIPQFSDSLRQGFVQTENKNRVKKTLDKLMKGRSDDLWFRREKEVRDVSYLYVW